jgi:hypothetical protein
VTSGRTVETVVNACDSVRSTGGGDCLRVSSSQHQGKLACLTALRLEATDTKALFRPQQRMMQNRVDVCRLTASSADVPRGAPRGWNCAAVKDSGNADQSDCGDNGTQLDGKSRVIHTYLNGEIGAACGLPPAFKYPTDAVTLSGCTLLESGCTCWTVCVHASGSGRMFVV